jgi:RHS repeat-associated protein
VYFASVEIRSWRVAGSERVQVYPHPSVKLTNGISLTAASTLHGDGLSSVRVTRARSTNSEASVYKPFGEQSKRIRPANTSPETNGWIGERYDGDARLQNLNARYYDPQLGMFLQPDWCEVTQAGVGTNRYSYALNDPINSRDASGNGLISDIGRAINDLVGAIGNALTSGNGNATQSGSQPRASGGKVLVNAGGPQNSDPLRIGSGRERIWKAQDSNALCEAVREACDITDGGGWGIGGGGAKRSGSSGGKSLLTGQTKYVNESMSARAAAYQSRATGSKPGTVYYENGVKFYGVDFASGKLLDAKYGLEFMVGKGGGWKDWARAPASLATQARRQIVASNGAAIEWRFSSEVVANATRTYFAEQGILGIAIVVLP